MRSVVQFLAFLCVAGLVFLPLQKKWKKGKLFFRVAVSCAASALFAGILFSFPVENLFCQWDSPESLFHYMSFRPIVGVVEGKNSCMIVSRESKSGYSGEYIVKRNGKYLMPFRSGSEQIVSQNIDNGNGVISISKFGEDYYVSGVTIFYSGEETVISDTLDSVFLISEITQVDLNRTTFFSAYLDGFNDKYSITVGEETTEIEFTD